MQRQDAIELRVAGAEIIDGNPRASQSVTRDHMRQALDVATQFGDLENDSSWVDVMPCQLLEAWKRLIRAQAADPARGNIQA
ncbi:hypothetical protein D3C84_1004240 [compost metagenome]